MNDETIRHQDIPPEEGSDSGLSRDDLATTPEGKPQNSEAVETLKTESPEAFPTQAPDNSATETPVSPTNEAAVETVAAAMAEAAAPELSAEMPPPSTTYRWTYAEQREHDRKNTGRGQRGILVYALIMTGVFLVSLGLLVAVLFLDGGSGSTGLIRPGISQPDSEAVVGVEKAKYSTVVIEVTKNAGGSTGTGIIMTADGYIATNHHVIEEATRVKVRFYDGSTIEATVVGSSEMDDLAVIKVERTGLTPATFGYSENCYVGQTVYAIGTPAGPDFAFTTTRGIISYKDREVKIYDETDGTLQKKLRLLQTDANVNPGNSGGPLINTDGEVVGVVSMKLAEGYEGIGFAIPSDGAVEILEAIMEYGNADNINSSLSHKRPVLGIVGMYLHEDVYYVMGDNAANAIPESDVGKYSPDEVIHPSVSGVYVVSVTSGLGADGKVNPGDIITAVQGETFTSMQGMMALINEFYAGDTVTLTVYRNGNYSAVEITLSAQAD